MFGGNYNYILLSRAQTFSRKGSGHVTTLSCILLYHYHTSYDWQDFMTISHLVGDNSRVHWLQDSSRFLFELRFPRYRSAYMVYVQTDEGRGQQLATLVPKQNEFGVSVRRVSLSPAPTVPTGLRRRVVVVVVLLVLLMSGDIETNPGPVGKWLF